MVMSFDSSSADRIDPSNAEWARLTLEAATVANQLRAYEENGTRLPWADAAMQVSAAARLTSSAAAASYAGLVKPRPDGPEADLFNGVAERLVEEYHQGADDLRLEDDDSLPQVRFYVAFGESGALDRLAETISGAESSGLSADHYSRPERTQMLVRAHDAMAKRLDDSRTGNPPADGPGTYGTRLGRETAEAGIQAIRQVVKDQELTRTIDRGLGAQAAPGTAPAATEQNGNTSQKPATGRETKSTDLGGRG
ncbi:hypothetical protein [Kribbella solani]|uniref:Uncharacterized protein n=1 Tax=Kribbella solani TaxID=236067 RepID=A0A841DX05_9ACTN|nr:hypothetical protein [Kribbella solani]MBB5982501.1 hypothetical protein [Kribbella solani]